MFSLQRALRQAKETLHITFQGLWDNHIYPEITHLTKRLQNRDECSKKDCQECSDELQEIQEDLIEMIEKKEKKIQNILATFRLAKDLTMWIDLGITALIILGISLLAHKAKQQISSSLIVFLFIIMVTLIKVTIDRFRIMPAVDRFGRDRYKKALRGIEKDIAKLTATIFAVERSQSRGVSAKKLVDMLEEGIESLED